MNSFLTKFLTKKGNKYMVKIATSLNTLMLLAVKVGKARSSGDSVRLEEAEKELKIYENLVKKSDETLTHMTRSQLS
jgi:hypothetical protein